MTRILTILTLLIFASCKQESDKSINNNRVNNIKKDIYTNILPFELTVYNTNFSTDYAFKYVLTNKDLKIIFQEELEGKKDSILFKTDLHPNETLNKLSNINIDNLQENYINLCIKDGSQLTIKFIKDRKCKIVHLSNYYQIDIGLAIELINSLVPQKYKIWYDKETLLKNQVNCK